MVEKAFGIIKEKLQNKKYEDVEIALNEKKTMTNLIAGKYYVDKMYFIEWLNLSHKFMAIEI